HPSVRVYPVGMVIRSFRCWWLLGALSGLGWALVVGCSVDPADALSSGGEQVDVAQGEPDGTLVPEDSVAQGELGGTGVCEPFQCDDGNPCTTDDCEAGSCIHVSREGVSCDDGDPCTHGDQCVASDCTGALLEREANVCDGLDEDCDGATDEDCTLVLRGGLVTDGGHPLTTDGAFRWSAGLGAPRFVGVSSTEKFVITPGLPLSKGDQP
ncbi:MAG: hypothetical protein VX938_04465, partial [Myxococcota bacterium]|nr:hypothetical protein [Myxococcota bacterium]